MASGSGLCSTTASSTSNLKTNSQLSSLGGCGGATGSENLTFKLVIGHESELLKSPSPQNHTHRWTVFIRGPNEAVLDQGVIQKVIFQLHDDFPNAKRVVKAPPYQVTETGYAGFTIPIFVYFVGSKQEFAFHYNMDLSYDASHVNKVTRNVEIKNPKPVLWQKLISLGAEVKVKKKSNNPAVGLLPDQKGKVSKFEDLFGPTIAVQQPTPTSATTPTKLKVSNPAVAEKLSRKGKKLKADPNSVVAPLNNGAGDSGSSGVDLVVSPSLSPSPPIIKIESHAQGITTGKERKKDKTKKQPPDSAGEAEDYSKKHKTSTKRSGSTEKNSPALNQSLLRDLIVAVGGDISDVESITSSRPSAPPSESPIFQTGGSPDREESKCFSNGCSKSPKIARNLQNNFELDREKDKDEKKKRKKRIKRVDSSSKKRKKHSHVETPVVKVEPGSPVVKVEPGSPVVKVEPEEVMSEPVEKHNSEVKTEPYDSCEVDKDMDGKKESSTSTVKLEEEETEKPTYLSRLRVLQQQIMTVKEPSLAQKLANIIFDRGSFDIREDKFLEFDLCSLNLAVIEQLFKCFERTDSDNLPSAPSHSQLSV